MKNLFYILIQVLFLLFISSARGAGNETIHPLPDSNLANFRTQSRTFWKEELPEIVSRYFRSDWVAVGGLHSPAPGCISPSFATEAFTNVQNRIVQSSQAIDYAAAGGNCANDTCWVVVAGSDAQNIGGSSFQRAGNSNYYVDCVSNQELSWPTDVARLFTVTLDGGNITAVQDLRNPASFVRGGTFDLDDPLYGGVCDGIADNASALSTVVQRLVADKGIISIPSGICVFNSTPTISANGSLIVGKGPFSTIFKRNFHEDDATQGFIDMPGLNMLTIFSPTSSLYQNIVKGWNTGGSVVAGTQYKTRGGASLETSDGLTFPVIPVNSQNSRTLDRYERGTFVPIVNGESVLGVGSYSLQWGTYVRVGRIVHIDISLGWVSHSGVGNLIITGLPFPVDTAPSYFATLSVAGQNFPTGANTSLVTRLGPTTLLKLYTANGANGALTQTPIVNAGSLIISGTYIAGN